MASLCQLADGAIQKLKHQYNQSGGPALEVTLAEVQEDLRIRPPKIIDNLDEVLLSNGVGNGHVEQGPGSGKTLEQTARDRVTKENVKKKMNKTPPIFQTAFAFNSSECPAGTCDSARNPLIGPEHHVCRFEHYPRRSPCGVHTAGLRQVIIIIIIIILIVSSHYSFFTKLHDCSFIIIIFHFFPPCAGRLRWCVEHCGVSRGFHLLRASGKPAPDANAMTNQKKRSRSF